MKTKEELSALKEEIETLNKKLAELTDEELAQVAGGVAPTDVHTDGVRPDTYQPKKSPPSSPVLE